MEISFHHCHSGSPCLAGSHPAERMQAQRQLCTACAVCCAFMAGSAGGADILQSIFRMPKFLGSIGRQDGVGWDGELGVQDSRKQERVRDRQYQGTQDWLISTNWSFKVLFLLKTCYCWTS